MIGGWIGSKAWSSFAQRAALNNACPKKGRAPQRRSCRRVGRGDLVGPPLLAALALELEALRSGDRRRTDGVGTEPGADLVDRAVRLRPRRRLRVVEAQLLRRVL